MGRPPKPVEMTLNLAPMVDVMMCLIIFFLLASKLVQAEQKEVRLPFALAAREVERSELGHTVVINVNRRDDGARGASFLVASFDGSEIRSLDLSPEQIERLLRARAASAARDGHKLRCLIRADKEVTYADVEVVLRACGLAKVSNVVFAAKAGEEPAP